MVLSSRVYIKNGLIESVEGHQGQKLCTSLKEGTFYFPIYLLSKVPPYDGHPGQMLLQYILWETQRTVPLSE